MALVTDFSRLRLKRMTTSGEVPTVPSTSEPDENWLPTDLLIGEVCVNTSDDRAWVRTNNGIREFCLSGSGKVTQTIDASPTDILSIPVATSELVWVDFIVVALDSTAKFGLTSYQQISYRNDAGTLNLVGANKTDNSDFSTASVSFSTSGTNIVISVTGELATTIDWTGSIKIQSVKL